MIDRAEQANPHDCLVAGRTADGSLVPVTVGGAEEFTFDHARKIRDSILKVGYGELQSVGVYQLVREG